MRGGNVMKRQQVQADSGCLGKLEQKHIWEKAWGADTSEVFLAEISLRSPRKLFILII